MLQIASVIGRFFRYRVLAAIAGTEPVAREASGLDRVLIELQREEMIREHSPLPEMEYIFKHELTRDAAYGGMLKKDRRSFHRRVAQALEDLYPERAEEQVEFLAHHWEHAGDVDRAIRYLTRAGDRAQRVGASLEAVAFYELGLSKAPDGVAGLHRIHERLGDVYLINLSRHTEALEHYQALFGLSESDEDWARGARKVAGVHMLSGDLDAAKELLEGALTRLARGPVSAEASRVHFALSSLFFLRNQLAEAESQAGASLGVSNQVADVRGLADANKALAIIAVNRGDIEAAIQHDQESLERYRELGDLPRTALACNNLGDSLRLMGRTSRAMEFLAEGLEIARRIGDTREETVILTSLAEVAIDRGDWEKALEYLDQALPLAEESGVVHNLTDVHWLLGSAYEGLGRLDDAGKHLSMAESLCRDTERLQLMPQIYLDQARVRVSRGTFDEAERLIKLALEAAGPQPSSVLLGVASRCSGYLDKQRGLLDGAVSHLEESLERLEGTKLPVEIAKTRQSLGTAYASRGAEGDRGRACEHLLAARSAFERSEASGRLAQVDVWLDKLKCGPRRNSA